MSAVVGIGVDLLRIGTIAPSVEREDDPFVQKMYTPAELALIRSRDLQLYIYDTRFA